MKGKSLYKNFKKYEVFDVGSIKGFCAKYYKHDRYMGRGKEYVNAVIESHKEYIEEFGYTIISHHDSITGQVVSFYH